jgi:hypothetical protein
MRSTLANTAMLALSVVVIGAMALTLFLFFRRLARIEKALWAGKAAPAEEGLRAALRRLLRRLIRREPTRP